MTKRLLGLLLVLLASVVVAPSFVTKTEAAQVEEYNISDAISYANKNWNNGRGLCAQFVSECLNAGGIDAYDTRVVNLYNELLENDNGKSYKLTLTNGTSGSIRMSDNVGKVKKGDPIFYYCNACKSYAHVVLCNGANSEGYIQDYAHNKAHNGKKRTYTYGHCGSENWTLYSISIANSDTLDVPEVKSVAGSATGVEVKWNTVKFADSYNVYRKVSGGSWLFLKNVKESTYVDTTAENGKTYVYTVRALNSKTRSEFKPSTSFKFIDKIQFSSISAVDGGVKLAWNKNTAATGYYIYRSVDGGNWVRYATITGNTKTTYTDLSVESGKYYRYRVRGFAGSSAGSYNATGVSINYVDTPVLKSCENTVEGVTFRWNTVTGATGYRVYRRAAGDKSWTYITTVTTNYYEDNTVSNEVYYKYTARAVCKNSFSGFEDGVLVKHIKTPEITSVECVDEGIAIQWENISGVTGYYLYRKAPGDKYWTRIAVVTDGNEYLDTNVTEGVEYTYTVKAYFGSRMSAYDVNGVMCKYVRKDENELEIPEIDDEAEDID